MSNAKQRLRTNNEQFYTDRALAKRLIDLTFEIVGKEKVKTIIEPSAGDGAFSLQLPHCAAFDIDPKHPSITKADFLTEPLITDPASTLIIGNPPFGRQAALAFRFIYKAISLADFIAFILPISFDKVAFQNRVPNTHTLAYSEVLPNALFLENGKPHEVPSVFQIWIYGEPRKEIYLKRNTKLFEFVGPEDCTLAIRRVGAKAGTLYFGEYDKLDLMNNYYIRCEPQVVEYFKRAKFAYRVGVSNSISKGELINEIEQIACLSSGE